MRKRSKLVVFLVLVTFLFSMVGTASAANFSDIDSSNAKSAIMKLSSLGVINGYEDGTFKPDNTITRAEFAKIAVAMAGLKDTAPGMQAVAGPFGDVAVADWFNGWVNVAAAQGYVKGFEGKFRPSDNVSQQEVITVLMRLLGYNDNLAGEWPFDYLAKASKEGMLDEVTLNAAAPATRGIVALLGNAALDMDVVEYDADANKFTLKGNDLLAENFKDGTASDEVIATNYYLSDGDQYLVLSNGDKIELAKDATVFGAANWTAAKENIIKYVTKTVKENGTDKEYVSYVEVMNYGNQTLKDEDVDVTYTANAAKVWIPTKAVINDKTYEMADDVVALGSTLTTPKDNAGADIAAPGAAGETTTKTYTHVDAIKMNPNDDGDIAIFKITPNYPNTGIIDSVDTAKEIVKLKENATTYTFDSTRVDLSDLDDTDYFVTLDGKPATLADLKENMLVYNNKGGRGVSVLFEAYSKTAAGKVESYSERKAGDNETWSIVVGGTKYLVKNGANYSNDGGDEFDKTLDGNLDVDGNMPGTAEISNLIGEEVTLLLDPIGQVQAIISNGESDSNELYGTVWEVIPDLASTEGGTKDYIRIMKKDGTVASYQVDSDSADAADAYVTAHDGGVGHAAKTNCDDFVKFTLQSNGAIDEFEAVTFDRTGTANDCDNDNRISVNDGVDSKWYTVDENVVVYNFTNPDDDEYSGTETWADLYNAVDSGDVAGVSVFDKDDDGLIDYIVLASGASLGTGDFYAVMGWGENADGYYVKVDRQGTTQTLKLSGKSVITTPDPDIKKFDIVTYTVSAGEITNIKNTNDAAPGTVKRYNSTTSWVGAPKVWDATSDRIKIGAADDTAEWVSVDADTIIYDVDEDDPTYMEAADVAEGDTVLYYAEDGVIKWMADKND